MYIIHLGDNNISDEVRVAVNDLLMRNRAIYTKNKEDRAFGEHYFHMKAPHVPKEIVKTIGGFLSLCQPVEGIIAQKDRAKRKRVFS